MKPKTFLMTLVLAAIACCGMTSCEKSQEKCEITIVNNTTNYAMQIYWDDKPLYSENGRLWPEDQYYILAYKGKDNYLEINNVPKITIEWYQVTGHHTYAPNPIRTKTERYLFGYGSKYLITVEDNNFNIKLTTHY